MTLRVESWGSVAQKVTKGGNCGAQSPEPRVGDGSCLYVYLLGVEFGCI